MDINQFPLEWNVIPAGKDKKYPEIKWEQYKSEKYPRSQLLSHDGNLAVVCGQTSENLFIIDLDYKGRMNDVYREHAFQTIYGKMCEEVPDLARTRVHKTPHGHHILYYLKGHVPKTEHFKNVFKGDVFLGCLLTKFHDFLDGVDLQGDKALAIVPPSSVGDDKYEVYFNSEIKTLDEEEFKRLKAFFLLDEPKFVRKGFMDIVNGKLDVHELKIKTGMDEHVYWKMLYVECYWNLYLLPEDLFRVLALNQPAFNRKKTEAQLKHVNFGELKPMTRETYEQYFPMYATRKEPSFELFEDESAKSILDMNVKQLTDLVSNMLLEEYDILTLSDSGQIMVREESHYDFNINVLHSRIKEICDGFSKGSYNAYKTNVELLLKDATLFERDDFNTDGNIINVLNGVYDVLDEKLIPRKEINEPFFYVIPWVFEEGNWDCPKFKSALNDWIMRTFKKKVRLNGRMRTIKLWQWTPLKYDDIFEMIGLCLSLNTGFKKAFLNYGPTHSGKTQFLNLIIHVIGDQNACSVKLHRLTKNEFGTKRLQMKLINACGEIPKRKIKQTDLFKELTGDDFKVPSEIKGGNQFEFKSYAKFWFNANDIPPLDYIQDDAFFDRFILLEFPNQFKPQTEDFELQFWKGLTEYSEIQGILHEALKGLKRLIERKGFRKEITKNTKHVWLMGSDPVYEFLNLFCNKKRGSRILCDELYELFNEVGSEYQSTRQFTIELEKHGIHKRQLRADYNDKQTTGKDRPYYYVNIELRGASPDEASIIDQILGGK